MADLSYDSIELGRLFGPWKYPLRERIARHLEAVENAHPWHHSRSPWGPPVAPPSILGNAALRFIDAIAPVPPGTLHAKQEIETLAALRLDRQPVGYGRFTDKYERRGRRWFVFESRWRDETGLIIGHSRVTMAFPGGGRQPGENDPPAQERSTVAGAPAEMLTPVVRTLTQDKMTAYSEDSANALRGTSIHVHPEVARQAGFPATVAQGLMAADYINEMLENALGRQWYEYSTLSLTFLKPMLCGDTIAAHGRLSESAPEGAVVRRTYEVWCENSAGQRVAAGTASALVMP